MAKTRHYLLRFDELGKVELFQIIGDRQKSLWQSDDDEDFADEFDGDFFGEDDAEEILDYLYDKGLMDAPDTSVVDIEEFSLSDIVDDDDSELLEK